MRKPKKLLNNPIDVCREQLEGMIAACGGDVQKIEGISAVVRKGLSDDRGAGADRRRQRT